MRIELDVTDSALGAAVEIPYRSAPAAKTFTGRLLGALAVVGETVADRGAISVETRPGRSRTLPRWARWCLAVAGAAVLYCGLFVLIRRIEGASAPAAVGALIGLGWTGPVAWVLLYYYGWRGYTRDLLALRRHGVTVSGECIGLSGPAGVRGGYRRILRFRTLGGTIYGGVIGCDLVTGVREVKGPVDVTYDVRDPRRAAGPVGIVHRLWGAAIYLAGVPILLVFLMALLPSF
ncbi:hypothetical protein ACIBJD_36170 [Kitasatospora sp. NPDC050467]|uniref:hypothetical protein n=1 Tax=Kitasatospora sp. NPDC050467 TaxID=3364053 RepID=UPI00378C1C51